MYALFGIRHGFLIGALHNANALYAHTKARRVHHDEHVFQSTIFFADQFTDRTTMITKLQHRRWTGFDAKFVLE